MDAISAITSLKSLPSLAISEGVRGYTTNNAHVIGLLNVLDLSCVNKKLHNKLVPPAMTERPSYKAYHPSEYISVSLKFYNN